MSLLLVAILVFTALAAGCSRPSGGDGGRRKESKRKPMSSRLAITTRPITTTTSAWKGLLSWWPKRPMAG